MYKVKDIIEPDFGCEGLPDGEEICCEVLLEDEQSGGLMTVRVPDAELYRKNITVGSRVNCNDGQLEPAQD